MPYVDSETRARLDRSDRTNGAQSTGQLTYQLQQVLLRYIQHHGVSYQVLAECLGSLEGAKLDLTERVVKPYEARKRKENGDVWPAALTEPDPPTEGEALALTEKQKRMLAVEKDSYEEGLKQAREAFLRGNLEPNTLREIIARTEAKP